ncbi:MAG: hypothetical protein HUU43_02630 [Ignavibacteriaceae bacterium]|nr:hypothetical protein [Ignavibacteriaceae bacterium]
MIKKYKTFEEARRDLWVMEPDEAYYKRVIAFYELAATIMKPRSIEKGFFRFKTFQDAQEHRRQEALRARK